MDFNPPAMYSIVSLLIDGIFPSDTHRWLAPAQLVDQSTFSGRRGDRWGISFNNRGSTSGGAGYTSSQSVVWNVTGNSAYVLTGAFHYLPRPFLSRQFGHGYIIGSSGDFVNAFRTCPPTRDDPGFDNPDVIRGCRNTDDYIEGIGRGATLTPASLYLDQKQRRLNGTPTISITSPLNGATLSGDILIKSSASDNGTITNVAFYAGNQLIGSVSQAPYEYLWQNVSAGTHVIRAVVADGDGNTAEDSVQISITDGTSNGGSEGTALLIVGVSASGDDGNVAANTLDGDLGTRWSSLGRGGSIQYDLGTTQTVSSVGIAWLRGDVRTSTFDVQVSTDGINYIDVLTNQVSSGQSLELESHAFVPTSARYVRIIGYGNSESNWNSITEVEIYAIPSNTGPLLIVGVSASGDDGNVAANTLDGDLGTRWSSLGRGGSIQYDLGTTQTVSSVGIAWLRGDVRTSTFDVQVSTDGINYIDVLTNQVSSGQSLELESHAFVPTSARYVRIIGYGNSESNWNSITKVEIL